jgi:hypothetical protein
VRQMPFRRAGVGHRLRHAVFLGQPVDQGVRLCTDLMERRQQD